MPYFIVRNDISGVGADASIHHICNVYKYIREEDIPAHTIFVIITDGMENVDIKKTGISVGLFYPLAFANP